MKNIILIIVCIFFSPTLWAITGYDILINDQGYDLKIELDFNNFETLQNIRQALIKSEVISHLSPNVQSVTYSGKPDDYQSLMVVKSFGVQSQLLSKCQESLEELKWTRSCILQTDLLDSGKYMAWKSDEVVCTQINPQDVNCLFSIKGKTKPITFLGIQILNEKSFAVKAKVQALNNFFKIYYFIKDHNLSTKLALAKFNISKIKLEIENFDSEATKVLKAENSYQRGIKLPEPN